MWTVCCGRPSPLSSRNNAALRTCVSSDFRRPIRDRRGPRSGRHKYHIGRLLLSRSWSVAAWYAVNCRGKLAIGVCDGAASKSKSRISTRRLNKCCVDRQAQLTIRSEIAVATIGCLTAFAVHVRAAALPYICNTYHKGDMDAPAVVRRYLEVSNDAYVDWCKRDDRFFLGAHAKYKDLVTDNYFSGSAARRYSSVCEYDYRRLRLSDASSALVRDGQSAKNYALASTGRCPMPPSTAYASVDNVSVEEFGDLARYWRSLIYTPDKLARALNALHDNNLLDRYRSKLEYAARSATASGVGLTVLRIRKTTDWRLFRRYELWIEDPSERGSMFLLYVDRWALYGFVFARLSYVAS